MAKTKKKFNYQFLTEKKFVAGKELRGIQVFQKGVVCLAVNGRGMYHLYTSDNSKKATEPKVPTTQKELLAEIEKYSGATKSE